MMRARLISTVVAFVTVASLSAACADEDDNLLAGRRKAGGAEDPAQDGTPGADPTQPGACKEGVPHPGFAGNDFVADRLPGALGANRRRVKPYSALRTEMQRALGQTPAAMAGSAAAYGDVPARWYAEPVAGAVSLYTTYGLAFTGCYDTMTDAVYTQMPTPATAEAECTKMQRKFWQRAPTPDESKACVDLAVAGLTAEPVARRRWAHACASILTAAGFTTY